MNFEERKADGAKRSYAARRTVIGHKLQMFNNQVNKSIQRGHKAPDYIFYSFSKWLDDKGFDLLWKDYEESDFNKELAPSCDRLDDDLGYSFNNIRLVTWKENDAKEHEKQKTKGTKAVESSDGKRYSSAMGAQRSTGIDHASILHCCKGRRAKAGGLVWKFQ